MSPSVLETPSVPDGWINRVRVSDSSEEIKTYPDKQSALESTIRSYVEKKRPMVVDPAVGTTFDSLDEAYTPSVPY